MNIMLDPLGKTQLRSKSKTNTVDIFECRINIKGKLIVKHKSELSTEGDDDQTMEVLLEKDKKSPGTITLALDNDSEYEQRKGLSGII